MYRWKTDNGYMRLGSYIYYISDHSAYNDLSAEWSHWTINPAINIGKEWREQISSRWIFSYGADLHVSYSAYRQENKNDTWDQDGDYTSVALMRNQEFGPGIQPFVGIMFKINQRLLLGTEASFLTRARYFIKETENYILRNGIRSDGDQSNEKETRGWNLHIRTFPANNIFVYYRS